MNELGADAIVIVDGCNWVVAVSYTLVAPPSDWGQMAEATEFRFEPNPKVRPMALPPLPIIPLASIAMGPNGAVLVGDC